MNNFTAPTCLDLEEFNNELKRFRYIARAFNAGNVNVRLILNHIIILYNVFGVAATEMLMFKTDKAHWHYLVPFLVYLNRLSIKQIDDIMLTTYMNEEVIAELRNL